MADPEDDFDSLISGRGPVATPPESVAAIAPPALPPSGIVEFNEDAYRLAYPDVAVSSEFEHYATVGRAEHRLHQPGYRHALAGGMDEVAAHGQLSFNIDTAIMSDRGTIFVVGWSDDRASPIHSVSVIQGAEGWNTRGVARCRRGDVEELLGAPGAYAFGYWFVHRAGPTGAGLAAGRGPVMLRARMADGRFCQVELTPRVVPEVELREIILGHFAGLQYLGNRDIEAFEQLDKGAGDAVLALNRGISASITGAAFVERFGPARSRFAASFIVCLFGKVEYFFLQNALFATGRGVAEIEFVYVSNSPELAETLRKEAMIAERVYGLSITLVTLPGNAGFSAANNAAARAARSDRIVFVNPDVFPRDDGWAEQHAAILEGAPREQTMLFGAPLYYDDGSLMHGGMHFVVDQGLSVKASGIRSVSMIRVEHYGKGAPAWSDTYSRPRAVPAVTGAFISADRSWFELLGGFTEDFVFGHYEDADLCLKSLQRGVPAWLQDIRFWHLEGKGSVRRPTHEGGSLVNRWLFTRRWGALVEASLSGRTPRHPLLNGVPGRRFPTAAPAMPESVPAEEAATPLAVRRRLRAAQGRA